MPELTDQQKDHLISIMLQMHTNGWNSRNSITGGSSNNERHKRFSAERAKLPKETQQILYGIKK